MRLRMIVVTVTLVLCCAFLGGCAQENAAPTEVVPMETVAATETTEPTVVAATEPEKLPFEDYEYLYTEERDRAWEEDVVFLAKAFLGVYPMKGHPLLVDKEVQVWKPQNYIDFQNFYQENMRGAFVTDLESLISQIPALTDTEILYEMQRIVGKLSDLHSHIYLPVADVFVFMVEPFYAEDDMQLRLVRLPAEYQDALFGELVSINGVPIDEVVDRVGKYAAHEWKYGKMYELTSIMVTGLIMRKEALQMAGIVDAEDTSAKLEIITEQGQQIFADVPAVAAEAYKSIDKVYGDWNRAKYSFYDGYQNTNYFLRHEEENQMLYIRFNREDEMTSYRFSDFIADIKKCVSENNCKKIVVDFRTNGGGSGMTLHEDFIEVLGKSAAEQIYILIDPASYSDAILLPVEIRQNLSNAVIVGTPGGQSPIFFAGRSYALPNSGHYFWVSMGGYNYWPDYEYDTLMPDITVYQTLEDYKQGIDTVLEYVRSMES